MAGRAEDGLRPAGSSEPVVRGKVPQRDPPQSVRPHREPRLVGDEGGPTGGALPPPSPCNYSRRNCMFVRNCIGILKRHFCPFFKLKWCILLNVVTGNYLQMINQCLINAHGMEKVFCPGVTPTGLIALKEDTLNNVLSKIKNKN